MNITNKSGKVITDKQWGGYGNDSVFDLERMQNDFGMGSLTGFIDNVPKLFDISMNSYMNESGANEVANHGINTVNKIRGYH